MLAPRTRVRILRFALPESPVDATLRLLDKLRTAAAIQDWDSW